MIDEDVVEEIDDEAEAEDEVASVRYNITSFGVDFDVEGAVRRLVRGDIAIPDFQRSYVWNQAEASRLIESLLLGLPVPGVFLASEPDTKQLLVIDGQQRLRSLQFFYNGEFNPSQGSESVKKFRLIKVQERFEGKTYQDLPDEDRRTLDNSVIHATVVKQESPENDDTGMYHIFERLNTGGRKLVPQEIRVAIYHGELINLLKRMNDISEWRSVYGPKSSRLKDQELLLRFLAFYTDWAGYSAPMAEFLSKYSKRNRHISDERATELISIFEKSIKLVHGVLGSRAFRIIRALNAAVFDSVMVALAEKYQSKPIIEPEKFRAAYQSLLEDETYKSVVSRSTGNEKSVELRIRLARDYLKNV
jgi:hypothetical protein